jgi:hypothetical protein
LYNQRRALIALLCLLSVSYGVFRLIAVMPSSLDIIEEWKVLSHVDGQMPPEFARFAETFQSIADAVLRFRHWGREHGATSGSWWG